MISGQLHILSPLAELPTPQITLCKYLVETVESKLQVLSLSLTCASIPGPTGCRPRGRAPRTTTSTPTRTTKTARRARAAAATPCPTRRRRAARGPRTTTHRDAHAHSSAHFYAPVCAAYHPVKYALHQPWADPNSKVVVATSCAILIGLYSSSFRNEKFHSSSQFWNGTEKKFPFLEHLELQFNNPSRTDIRFSSVPGTELSSRNCSSMLQFHIPIHSA